MPNSNWVERAKKKSVMQGNCLVFTGAVCGSTVKYGTIRNNHSKMEMVHRLSYKKFVGPLLDGEEVRHTCDNGRCWNPFHLLKGSTKDNVQDKVDRDRVPKWEAHWAAVLTIEQAREIRSLYNSGITQKEIGRRYGVHQTHVSQIVLGKLYKEKDNS